MEVERYNEATPFSCSTVDKLSVRVYETRQAMGTDAAALVAEKILELLREQEFVNMIFAAAPSQNEFLAALIQQNGIDWSRMNAFHMDEYIGLETNAPQGFGNFLKEKLFIKLPFCAVNYINGNAADPQTECERYAAVLAQYPADIVCMGIGENAHIAFNDPHVADFNDPQMVKVVSLDAMCCQQQVNDGCFIQLTDVPTNAITLTVPALMAAKFVYCMVPGKNKAEAVAHTLKDGVSEQYPSTVLRVHDNAILFLDADSNGLM